MKPWKKHILFFLGISFFSGIFIWLSGIIPLTASSGHWDITKWFLSIGMKRSVETYTIGKSVPELGRPWMIQKGAGHYEIGCRQCHGAPGDKDSLFGNELTPNAPWLPSQIHKWEPDELFRIVKHGVKFTGMPAWAALQRNDEVWAMVSFLRSMPNLSGPEYEKMATILRSGFTNPDYQENAGKLPVLQSCANCHGMTGNGRETSAFPKLAGQNLKYLEHSLKAYAKDERHSGPMELMAASLKKEEVRKLSLYFSKQKRISPSPSHHLVLEGALSEAIKRGADIAHKGIPQQRVASCVACHGPHLDDRRMNPHFPNLSGQFADYIALQLKLFLKNKRGGTKYANVMHKALYEMTPQQMRDVALYYESLTLEKSDP